MRPIRRSELTCPGHSRKMMDKAAASDADEVIFDLEDACATSLKDAARSEVARAFRELKFTNGKVRAYRINGVDTPWCYRDLVDVLEAAGARVDTVVVPKVKSAADVQFVDKLVSQLEWAKRLAVGRIRLEVLIETAGGLVNVAEIARSSARLDSLIFGVADFAGDLGSKDFKADRGGLFAHARAQLLIAARAAGLDAIDRSRAGRDRRALGRALGVRRQVGDSPRPARADQRRLHARPGRDRSGAEDHRGLQEGRS
jgi:citrate lyase subunit beta / citryl-CoA lyase